MKIKPNRFTSAFQVTEFPIGEVRRHEVDADRNPVPSLAVQECKWYYKMVPKGMLEQVKWRAYVRKRGMHDARFRNLMIKMASEDILFFANTFVYVYEPRPFPRYLPMNTWPDQDDHLAWMDECFGVRDFGAEKSRGVGFTYDFLVLMLQKWLFKRNIRMGAMSRDETSIDKLKDPNTVLGKLDLMFDMLPIWLRVDRHGKSILDRATSDHRFNNRSNGASILGFAATGDAGSGGRLTAMFMDEFGKFKDKEDAYALQNTQNITNCRYFISTFKGNSNEFFRMMRPRPGQESTMLKVVADWRDNPQRSRGLYTSANGEIIFLDEEYEHSPDYKFILDGKIRSPWYDAECRRPGATPRRIAEELDRDPRGSTSKFFSDLSMRTVKETVRPPDFVGEIEFTRAVNLADHKKGLKAAKFRPTPVGRLKLYLPLRDGVPEFGGPYTIGGDIAGGGATDGTSNSALAIIDQSRNEQVGEFMHNGIMPSDLADYAYAIAYWLSRGRGEEIVYLGFENNGPLGSQFAKRIRELEYSNLYWRESKSDTGKEKTKYLGVNNQDKGEEILAELMDAVTYNELIVRSEDAYREFDEYEYKNGILIHKSSDLSEDGASKGKPHGDTAIALAIALRLHKDRPLSYKDPEDLPPPPNSVAAMYTEIEEQKLKQLDPWERERRSLEELMGQYSGF